MTNRPTPNAPANASWLSNPGIWIALAIAAFVAMTCINTPEDRPRTDREREREWIRDDYEASQERSRRGY
jgi:hypothetical protein